jgi:hypothetical protein
MFGCTYTKIGTIQRIIRTTAKINSGGEWNVKNYFMQT